MLHFFVQKERKEKKKNAEVEKSGKSDDLI